MRNELSVIINKVENLIKLDWELARKAPTDYSRGYNAGEASGLEWVLELLKQIVDK